MKTLALTLSLMVSSSAMATEAQVGQPAVDFSLPDLNGKAMKLSDFRGKTVVLEWFNPGCPFVVYAHESGPLNTLAADAAKDDVVWLAINSSAPEKQGHGVTVNKQSAATWAMNHPILVDEDGKVGKAYGAVTTPQMFVVDKKGTLVYAGALDNAPRGRVPESGFVNHVTNALTDLKNNQAVKTAKSRPYGCSVKY